MTASEFSYGSVYNQVTEVREFDYGGTTMLRATRTQYQNDGQYTARHIFNLPLTVEVFAGDGVTRVSRTDSIDAQSLLPRPGVIQHDHSFNPYCEEEGQCWDQNDPNDCDCTFCRGEAWGEVGDGYCNQDHVCPYTGYTNPRGNVTQITTYANAGTEPAGNPISENRRFDITGNLVTTSTSCCEQTSFNYTSDTHFGYPLSQTRGSLADPYTQVTTRTTYDFHTGLVLSATDANGRVSGTSYLENSLRPQTVSRSSGAHTDYGYDDAALTVTETTYLESHPTHTTIVDQSIKLLNGRGQVRQSSLAGRRNWVSWRRKRSTAGRPPIAPYSSGTPVGGTISLTCA